MAYVSHSIDNDNDNDHRARCLHQEEEEEDEDEIMNILEVEVCCKPILSSASALASALASRSRSGSGSGSEQPVPVQLLQGKQEEQYQLSDYELLQQEHHIALEALRQLAQGVRIVTRQMKQQEQNNPHGDNYCYDNDYSVASNNNFNNLRARTFSSETTISVCSSVLTEDDRRAAAAWQEVVMNAAGTGATDTATDAAAADILGLSQAAQMVKEHARLASQEAELLTDDMAVASRNADDATRRAFYAEQAAAKSSHENAKLVHQLEQLKMERKVLAKEVKALRKEKSALKQFHQDYQRQKMLLTLEHHVRGALIVHEEQLAIATKSTLNDCSTDEGAVAEKMDPSKTYAESIAAPKIPSSESKTQHVAPNKEPETSALVKQIRLVGGFPAKSGASKTKRKITPTTKKLSSIGGFGGSGGLAGMAAYKFNRPTVKIPKRRVEAKISLETPTNASTVVTETNMTPESNESDPGDGARCNNNDKENDKEASVDNHQSSSNADKRLVPSALSAFLGFLSADATIGSHPSRSKVVPVDGAKDIKSSHNNNNNNKKTSKHLLGLTIDSSSTQEPPLIVNVHNKKSLLSPFAEDSPVSASTICRVGKCDDQALRSLSLPDEGCHLMEYDNGDNAITTAAAAKKIDGAKSAAAAKKNHDANSAATAAKKIEEAKRSSLRRQRIHALF